MKVNKAFMQEINTWHKIILSFRVKASIMSEGKSECNSMCVVPKQGLCKAAQTPNKCTDRPGTQTKTNVFSLVLWPEKTQMSFL